MPLPKEPYLKIYDPRRGEDYEIETLGKERITTLEHQFLVIDYFPGRLPVTTPDPLQFTKFNKLIKASLLENGKIGFFAISPSTKEVRGSQLIHSQQYDEMSNTLVGYFDLSLSMINSHFDLRHERASYSEWVIGSCKTPFNRPAKEPRWYQEAIFWNIDFLFTQVENIGSLSVFFGETGELLFFTRLFDGIDGFLEDLK